MIRDRKPGWVVMYRVRKGSPAEEEVKEYVLGLREGTTASKMDLEDFERLMRPDDKGFLPRIWILPAEDDEWRRTFRGIRKVESYFEDKARELYVLRMQLGSGSIVAIIAGRKERGNCSGI